MRLIKEFVIVVVALLALVYLINPTAGVFELIPDVFPIIGNLDEAGAMLILINTLAYYGLDLSKLLGTRAQSQQNTLYKRDDEQPRLKG